MGYITGAYIFPHPPILVPEVGKGAEKEAQSTINAFKEASKEIGRMKPDTIILTTPHGPVFQDFIHINMKHELKGSFKGFNAPEVKLSFKNDLELAESIIKISNKMGIPSGGLNESLSLRYRITGELDHGALVPLYFVANEYKKFKLVHISIAGLSFNELYRFGCCISQAINLTERKVVFIASGDLSHKLKEDGPYGFDSSGPEYDRKLVEYLKVPDPSGLLQFNESYLEKAGECGLRSFIMMFGALDDKKIESRVYSYEGPFGVGYAVASFKPVGEVKGEKLSDRLDRQYVERINMLRISEDPHVALARKALEMYVTNGTIIGLPEVLPEDMAKRRAGVFVSIKKFGQLRGCIGTIAPTKKNIAEEIIYNAISAGTRDPRFNPVEEHELDSLVYSVDVLGEAEPIDSIDELDVKRYGVIVRAGSRSGLLLPDLEGVDTPYEQVSIALRKAGISPSEKYTMERFEVIRYS